MKNGVSTKLIDDGIDVIRILHQRMDFERHL